MNDTKHSNKFHMRTTSMTLSITVFMCAIVSCFIGAVPAAKAASSDPVIVHFTTETASGSETTATNIITIDSIKSASPNDVAEVDQSEESQKDDMPQDYLLTATTLSYSDDNKNNGISIIDYITLFGESLSPEEVIALYAPAEKEDKFLADELGIEYTLSEPGIEVSDEEINLAATIIQLEVMGPTSSMYDFDDVPEKYWEMLAVASCILNRARSDHFKPSTVKDVIMAYGVKNGKKVYQFSPAPYAQYYTPTEEAVKAATEVLRDGVTILSDNYYYFCATKIESKFEQSNRKILSKDDNGNAIKVQGHLTTFFAGKEN